MNHNFFINFLFHLLAPIYTGLWYVTYKNILWLRFPEIILEFTYLTVKQAFSLSYINPRECLRVCILS